MKSIIRYLNVIIGCLLIAISVDFIVIPNNLLTFGVNGLSTLIYYIDDLNPAINIFIINFIIIVISSIFLHKNVIKVYLLPSILIPLFIFLLLPLSKVLVLELPEMLLVIIVAGVLCGYGYSMIYKQGFSAGTIYLFEELIGHLTHFHSKLYSWIIDVTSLIVLLLLFGYHVALYSLVIVVIAKYMITKSRFGINESKMFYIITKKEKEVKDYIIHDLKYQLTVLDVKGGFTKKNNQILLAVIDTKDYYKLKEGIKLIDENAFIAITDTYDVVSRKAF